jgi:hypothetical protein
LPDAGRFMLWSKTGTQILLLRGNELESRAF